MCLYQTNYIQTHTLIAEQSTPALVAQAVLLGRPYVYGLALGGEDGVRHVLRALRQDFELAMRLTGLARLGDLGPDCLQRRPGCDRS